MPVLLVWRARSAGARSWTHLLKWPRAHNYKSIPLRTAGMPDAYPDRPIRDPLKSAVGLCSCSVGTNVTLSRQGALPELGPSQLPDRLQMTKRGMTNKPNLKCYTALIRDSTEKARKPRIPVSGSILKIRREVMLWHLGGAVAAPAGPGPNQAGPGLGPSRVPGVAQCWAR